MYDNLTIKEFLGLILIFPIFLYVSFVLIKFIGDFRDFFDKDDEDKNIFHHHFHYKDKTYAPPRNKNSENL